MIKKELEELKVEAKKGLRATLDHLNNTVLKDDKVEVPTELELETTKKKITVLKFIFKTHPDKHSTKAAHIKLLW